MSAGRRLGTTVVQDAPAERPRPRSRSPLVPEQSEPSLPCGGPEAALERVSHLRVAPRQSLTMPFLIAFGIMRRHLLRSSRRGLGQAVKAAEEVCPDATTLQVAALRSLTEHIVVRAHNAGGGHHTCAVPLDSQRGLYYSRRRAPRRGCTSASSPAPSKSAAQVSRNLASVEEVRYTWSIPKPDDWVCVELSSNSGWRPGVGPVLHAPAPDG